MRNQGDPKTFLQNNGYIVLTNMVLTPRLQRKVAEIREDGSVLLDYSVETCISQGEGNFTDDVWDTIKDMSTLTELLNQGGINYKIQGEQIIEYATREWESKGRQIQKLRASFGKGQGFSIISDHKQEKGLVQKAYQQ